VRNVLAIVLAGGAGERLAPLTLNTAKPAVPFGGCYRIIDFTLSNCINSGIRRIFILTQYKALELTRHIREGWNLLSGELNEFVEVIPPMKRIHQNWYLGTADAVYQNIESIMVEKPELTLILSGDPIFPMMLPVPMNVAGDCASLDAHWTVMLTGAPVIQAALTWIVASPFAVSEGMRKFTW
jgi:glucose-1-phosphate adenylyltransferase